MQSYDEIMACLDQLTGHFADNGLPTETQLEEGMRFLKRKLKEACLDRANYFTQAVSYKQLLDRAMDLANRQQAEIDLIRAAFEGMLLSAKAQDDRLITLTKEAFTQLGIGLSDEDMLAALMGNDIEVKETK